jgi:hypothetical protein
VIFSRIELNLEGKVEEDEGAPTSNKPSGYTIIKRRRR